MNAIIHCIEEQKTKPFTLFIREDGQYSIDKILQNELQTNET